MEKDAIIDGSTITEGDVVLGLASSGAHSNGYSLVRKIIALSGIDLDADFHGQPFRDVVMAPTRIYVKPLLKLLAALPVKGMAHITGGGLTGNVPRVLPQHLMAEIDGKAWTLPPLFRWLQTQGNVTHDEMHRTFNCGIGMVAIVSAADAERAKALLEAEGETVFTIGKIRRRAASEEQTVVLPAA